MGPGRRAHDVLIGAFAILVAVVILGPMLAPGFPLRFDLVSVPRPVLGDDALGLGDRLPRAIPLDGATAVLAKVLPDAWLTQLLALLALSLAGIGAARLAAVPLPGRLVAVLAAQWNPFVLEQLAIGHVPHLLAYGAAPWAGLGGWWLTSGSRRAVRAWAVLILAVALGSLTPGGGVLVALAALAGLVSGARSVPDAGRPLIAGLIPGLIPVLLLQLPWLAAAAMAPGFAGAEDSRAGLTAFALNGETGWGRLVDAAGLGGMWNQQALPTSRGTVLAQLSTVLVIALAIGGAAALRARQPTAAASTPQASRQQSHREPIIAAAVVSALCYLIAVLPVLPGGERVLQALVDAVPGAGLIRDGHRWLALPALGFAVLAAHAVTGLARLLALGTTRAATPGATQGATRAAVPGATSSTSPGTTRAAARRAQATFAVLAGLLLIATMPDLGWGLSGRLQAWHYPAGWAAVRTHLDRQDDSARVLILPFQPFRTFAWSGSSAVLDPAPRLLPRQTIVSDALPVSGQPLPPEGPGSRTMTTDLADGELTQSELGALAIGWVLVEQGTPGEVPTLPPGWTIAAAGPGAQLWRAPGTLPAAPRPATTRLVAVTGSQVLFGLLVLVAAALLLADTADRAMRRKRTEATIGDRGQAPIGE